MGLLFFSFLSAGQSIQFTGYRVTYDVTALTPDPNTYGNIWFLQTSSDLNVVQASPIPEPTSLTLLGIGAVSLFGYGWRRKRKLAA